MFNLLLQFTIIILAAVILLMLISVLLALLPQTLTLPGGGTEEVRVEDGRRRVQKLTDAQILRLAAIGRTIETHFGSPQDIEWAVQGDQLIILQSRPFISAPGR